MTRSRRSATRIAILFFVSGLAACVSSSHHANCLPASNEQVARANALLGKGASAEQTSEARRLLLDAARCGNPKAPLALAASFMTGRREDMIPTYGWLGVVTDRKLEDAAFARHLMKELESGLSPSELRAAKEAVRENDRQFGSEE